LVLSIGVAYAMSAGVTVALAHWWPLIMGLSLVWVLRLLWLDSDVPAKRVHEEDL
jgi:hypothetical protein